MNAGQIRALYVAAAQAMGHTPGTDAALCGSCAAQWMAPRNLPAPGVCSAAWHDAIRLVRAGWRPPHPERMNLFRHAFYGMMRHPDDGIPEPVAFRLADRMARLL